MVNNMASISMWQVIEMFMESDTYDFMWLLANEECGNETGDL